MSEGTTSRREVLRNVAAGTGAVAISGMAGASTGKGSDRKIVGLSSSEGARAAETAADSVHRTLDFGDIGTAVAGNFSDEAIDQLRRNHDVRYVEADGTMRALHHKPGHDGGPGDGGGTSSECLPWGVDRVDADTAASNGETGSGAEIAIIDTGIDDDHPDLQDQIDTTKSKAWVDCKGPNCNYPWSDDNDHGSHCAGISDAVNNNSEGVQGVSTEATLVALKVLDKRGSGSFSDVAAAIEYTADNNIEVGSMSLGASSGSQTVKDACQYAYDNGVLLVAAAGNDGPCTDCVGYPAAYSTVMAISATTKNDSLADFSSTGPEVELAAPGKDIYSSVIGGYDTFSGTSMACPHVSGAGGLLMANGQSNTEARDTLGSSAEDIGLSDNESGHGLLDAAAALGLDSSDDGTGNC